MLINLSDFKGSDRLTIDTNIEFNEEDIEHSDLIKLDDVSAIGELYYLDSELIINLNVKGIMVLPDAITLEELRIPFDININESLSESTEENNEYFDKIKNTLDIKGILWQNIVLEVPIRVTKNETHEKLFGEGWELIDENEKRIDPRLAKLSELLDEGKE